MPTQPEAAAQSAAQSAARPAAPPGDRNAAGPAAAAAVEAAVAAVEAAGGRFAERVAGLDRAALRAPSLLPGWTRGHVVSHVARNAEALLNLLATAATGEPRPMYPSMAERAAAIEAGAGRAADEQLTDLLATARAFAAAARELPTDRWDAPVTLMTGRVVPARWALPARLREVEFHHVDLAAGYTPAHWDPAFVELQLQEAVAALTAAAAGQPDAPDLTLRATDPEPAPAAAPVAGEPAAEAAALPHWRVPGGGPAVTVTGPRAALLAWVCGRSTGDGLQVDGGTLPALPPWP